MAGYVDDHDSAVVTVLTQINGHKNIAQRVEDIITSLNVHGAPLNTPSKGSTAPVAYDDL